MTKSVGRALESDSDTAPEESARAVAAVPHLAPLAARATRLGMAKVPWEAIEIEGTWDGRFAGGKAAHFILGRLSAHQVHEMRLAVATGDPRHELGAMMLAHDALIAPGGQDGKYAEIGLAVGFLKLIGLADSPLCRCHSPAFCVWLAKQLGLPSIVGFAMSLTLYTNANASRAVALAAAIPMVRVD